MYNRRSIQNISRQESHSVEKNRIDWLISIFTDRCPSLVGNNSGLTLIENKLLSFKIYVTHELFSKITFDPFLNLSEKNKNNNNIFRCSK